MIKGINTIITFFISNILVGILLVLWFLVFYYIKYNKFNKNEDLITHYLVDNMQKVMSFCSFSYMVIYLGTFFVTISFCKNLNINYSQTIFIIFYALNLIITIYQYLKDKEKLIERYKEKLTNKSTDN